MQPRVTAIRVHSRVLPNRPLLPEPIRATVNVSGVGRAAGAEYRVRAAQGQPGSCGPAPDEIWPRAWLDGRRSVCWGGKMIHCAVATVLPRPVECVHPDQAA